MDSSLFGPPRQWRDDDLIAVSRTIDAETVVEAYRNGVFPMPVRRGLMGWWSPLDRGILPLDGLRMTRSLRKMLHRYEVRVDTAFDQVLRRCADPRRPGAWIDDDIRAIYTRLHRAGIVHSVESWTHNGQLVGGLYGVSIGGLFAGESMFHDPVLGRDASKVALVALVERLLSADGLATGLAEGAVGGGAARLAAGSAGLGERLLDVQWQTPHLASLGVVEIERSDYLRRLARALAAPAPDWTSSIRD